jgi:hypothetical protein
MSSSGSSSSSLSLRPAVVGSFPLTVSFETSGKNHGASDSGASDSIELSLVETRGPNSKVLHWRVNFGDANRSLTEEIPLTGGQYFLKATGDRSVALHDLAPFQKDPLESLKLNVSKDPVNLLNPDEVKTGLFSSSLFATFLVPQGFNHRGKIVTERQVEARLYSSGASPHVVDNLISLVTTFKTQTSPIPPNVIDTSSTAPWRRSMGPIIGKGFTLTVNTSSSPLFKPTNAIVSFCGASTDKFLWRGYLDDGIVIGGLTDVPLSRDTQLCVINDASDTKRRINLFDLLTKQPTLQNGTSRKLSDINAVVITIKQTGVERVFLTEEVSISLEFKRDSDQKASSGKHSLYSLTESREQLVRGAERCLRSAKSFALVDRDAGSRALPCGESSSAASSSSSSSATSASFSLPQLGVQSGVEPSCPPLLAKASLSAPSSSSSSSGVPKPIKRKVDQSSGGGSGSR